MLSGTSIPDADGEPWESEEPVISDTEIGAITAEPPARTQVSGVGCEKRKTRSSARTERTEQPERTAPGKDNPLTRALRSHQLWLTLTYFALLILMARGLAG